MQFLEPHRQDQEICSISGSGMTNPYLVNQSHCSWITSVLFRAFHPCRARFCRCVLWGTKRWFNIYNWTSVYRGKRNRSWHVALLPICGLEGYNLDPSNLKLCQIQPQTSWTDKPFTRTFLNNMHLTQTFWASSLKQENISPMNPESKSWYIAWVRTSAEGRGQKWIFFSSDQLKHQFNKLIVYVEIKKHYK